MHCQCLEASGRIRLRTEALGSKQHVVQCYRRPSCLHCRKCHTILRRSCPEGFPAMTKLLNPYYGYCFPALRDALTLSYNLATVLPARGGCAGARGGARAG